MRKKSYAAVLLAAMLTLSSAAGANTTGTDAGTAGAAGVAAADAKVVSGDSDVGIAIRGEILPLSTPARLEHGTTMVPLRSVAEALGATVDWNASESNGQSVIVLTLGNKSAAVTIGSTVIRSLDGRTVTVEVAPYVRGGVTMVPVRAVSELLGAIVAWDGLNGIVHIDDPLELPVIGTESQLRTILQQMAQTQNNYVKRQAAMDEGTAAAAAETSGTGAPAPTTAAPESPSAGGALSNNAAAEPSSAPAADADVSQTNVQVQGVDEADWAKTDGRYVYQLSGSRIFIVDIVSSAAPELAATIDYSNESGFYPQEMYIDGNRLIVIGQQHGVWAGPVPMPMPAEPGVSIGGTTDSESGNAGVTSGSAQGGGTSGSGAAGSEGTTSEANGSSGGTPAFHPDAAVSAPDAPATAMADGDPAVRATEPMPTPGVTASPNVGMTIRALVPSRTTVKTIIYELDAQGQPTKVRETELEGNYVSSRKIGSSVYLVTNKYNYIYPFMETKPSIRDGTEGGGTTTDSAAAEFEPVYLDTAGSGELESLPLSQIRYFPESPESSTMLIGAIDIDRPDQEMHVSAYLGSGQTIYASTKHLYIAVGKADFDGERYVQQTKVYKFRLDQGSVVYVGEGTVPGTILNQFSMDEFSGYFRIATTNGDMWASGAATSTNNLYVLDERLQLAGSLEGLAPGERIYSVRFMGPRAYMVTFRNVDPLFVVDLRNPAQPALLGQLKIPGYSDYLHPYDENHLIGFGKETIEVPSKGWGPDETTAFYQGMKIALFDVSDVSNPKEKFKEIIGDRGTHSELLYNHKALLFSKEKGLMAFPVELMEIPDKQQVLTDGFPAYGQFVYQGAYVYRVDLEAGFQLRGRITHLSEDDLAKSGWYGYDYGKSVRRILYAGDTLYTLSERMLKANDMNSLGELGMLEYPLPPNPYGYGYGSSPGSRGMASGVAVDEAAPAPPN